jgi:DNA-binding NtrC family response regulator
LFQLLVIAMSASVSAPQDKQSSTSWMKDLLAHSIIARSATMRALHERIDMLAPTNMTVLLTGETGVGKELVAEYIHRISPRIQHPFIKVGLAALPPELLESELFGHEKGAFTHAIHEKRGLFELANSGTIFLDDIDDFPLNLQVKLLRVLEAHEIMHVGGTRTIPIDTRVICASKVDLKDLVDRNLFRSDLYYRINVVPILIPPLRERKEDIPILLEHFLRRYAPDKNLTFTPQALKLLEQYSWAGNIRELKNVVQRLALFCSRRIAIGDLPTEIRDENPIHHVLKSCTRCFAEGRFSLDELLACLEYQMLKRALEEAEGNRSVAAKSMRMSLSTFRDRIRKHGLDGEGRTKRCD